MLKKIITLSALSIAMFTQSYTIQANERFIENEEFYTQLCDTRTSFNLNIETCQEFNEFLSTDIRVIEMSESINDEDLDLESLVKLIHSNNNLIRRREQALSRNKRNKQNNIQRIALLERHIHSSLAFMQESTLENQIIDFVMGSSSFDEMMIRIDGFSAITSANNDTIIDLTQAQIELQETQRILERDLEILTQTKAKQERLLLEFQRREIELYEESRVVFSSNAATNLSSVNIAEVSQSSNWGLPTRSGIVTASTWAYAFGGWHPGLDIALPIGSPLIAPADGIVLARASGFGGYGNYMVTAHRMGDFIYTMIFAHLNAFNNVVEFNQGDVIGFTGNTGFSTGPHVHIEVIRHNTDDLEKVVNQFRRTNDHWFGLGYTRVGDCIRVCRLKPAEVFNLRMGQRI